MPEIVDASCGGASGQELRRGSHPDGPPEPPIASGVTSTPQRGIRHRLLSLRGSSVPPPQKDPYIAAALKSHLPEPDDGRKGAASCGHLRPSYVLRTISTRGVAHGTTFNSCAHDAQSIVSRDRELERAPKHPTAVRQPLIDP